MVKRKKKRVQVKDDEIKIPKTVIDSKMESIHVSNIHMDAWVDTDTVFYWMSEEDLLDTFHFAYASYEE